MCWCNVIQRVICLCVGVREFACYCSSLGSRVWVRIYWKREGGRNIAGYFLHAFVCRETSKRGWIFNVIFFCFFLDERENFADVPWNLSRAKMTEGFFLFPITRYLHTCCQMYTWDVGMNPMYPLVRNDYCDLRWKSFRSYSVRKLRG